MNTEDTCDQFSHDLVVVVPLNSQEAQTGDSHRGTILEASK